jgi:hypothetical protein
MLEWEAEILRKERRMDILLVRWIGNLVPNFLTPDDAQIVVDHTNVAWAIFNLNWHTGRRSDHIAEEAREVRDLIGML